MNPAEERRSDDISSHEQDDELFDLEWRVNVTRSLYLDAKYELEEGGHLHEEWFAELRGNTERFGSATLHLFRNARQWDVADACDGHSEDLATVAGAITTKAGRLLPRLLRGPLENARTLVIVDRLRMEPRVRGRGMGTEFLWRSLDGVLGDHKALIGTYPHPIEVKKPTPADKERVRRFWVGAGFVHFGLGVFVGAYPGTADPEELSMQLALQQWRTEAGR